jgi:3-phenylpropionate/trans-cinnamate dioxygenase ferredoxin subunit
VSDAAWIAVADADRVPDGGVLAVYPKGVAVLLVKAGGSLYAVANKCAHMACPLEVGRIEGTVLTCPCHDWRFDVRDGSLLEAPEVKLTTYSCRVEDGGALVRLEKAPG